MVEGKPRSDDLNIEEAEHSKSCAASQLQDSMEMLASRKQAARATMHDRERSTEDRAKAAADFTHCQFELEQLAKRQIQAIESNTRPLMDAMEALSLRKKAAAALLKGSSLSALERLAAEKEVAYCQSELEQLATRQIHASGAAKVKTSKTRHEAWVATPAASDWPLRDAMEALALRKETCRLAMANTQVSFEERKQAGADFTRCQAELEQLALKQIEAIESNTRPLMDAMEALSRRKRAAAALLQDAAQTPLERSAAEKELAHCQSELERLAAQQIQFLKLANFAKDQSQRTSAGEWFSHSLSPSSAGSPYLGFGCIPFADMSEILAPPAGLYLSSRPPAECETWLTSAKQISAILDVTNAHSPGSPCASPWGSEIRYLNIPVFDTSETDLTCYFDSAADFIHRARGDGLNVLVHCEQGISRSVSCVLAYLVMHQRRPLIDAFRLVESCRPIACPNPAFCLQLMSLEPATEECLLAVVLLERGCADLKQQGVTPAMLTKAILQHQPDWWAAVSELRQQQEHKLASKPKPRSRSLLPKISIPKFG